jgi:hypothetical protein
VRIESPRYTERFGSVRINDVQKVLELYSGRARFETEIIKTGNVGEHIMSPRLA